MTGVEVDGGLTVGRTLSRGVGVPVEDDPWSNGYRGRRTTSRRTIPLGDGVGGWAHDPCLPPEIHVRRAERSFVNPNATRTLTSGQPRRGRESHGRVTTVLRGGGGG